MYRGTVVLACALLVGASPALAQTSDPDVLDYREHDASVTALNILPPGQGRYMNGPELALAQATGEQPPHNTDQMEMYDRMVQGAPEVTEGELADYFKDASLGVRADDIAREYGPRTGVTVRRDGYGVPHVYGATRSDTMFGAGYVTAEDRLFMIDTLRHVGRGRTSEFLGASEANLAMDRASYLAAGYTEDELQQMIDRGTKLDPEIGAIAQQDLEDFTAGVNAFIGEARADPSKLPGEYEALQQLPEDWKPTDTVAVASLIGSQLGVGGGRELDNAAFLEALRAEGFSARAARRVLADFRFANDPEAPTTTNVRFDYRTARGRTDPRSVALPDRARDLQQQMSAATAPTHIDGPFGRIALRLPEAASNALLVGPQLSASGRPIAVFGPQVAYWSPEILMEMELVGPGIHTRGVGFPGISQYTLLGRGRNYAYSATSAGGDQVDIFAERLCDPEGGEPDQDSTFYLEGRKCVEMYERTDQWVAKPSAAGFPPEPGGDSVLVTMTTQRTDDGIVQARGTIDDEPVAFVAKRSTFKKEVDSAGAYVLASDPGYMKSARDFQRAFALFGFTFNWFYLDHRDIAFQLGGYHPLRAPRTDLDLPVWGTNDKWDWQGRLSFDATPKDISPAKGFITSWNNKQAPGFAASDGQYSFGPVHRVDPLDAGIERVAEREGEVSLVDLVNIMGDAATVDLRGFKVLPVMLDAVGRPRDDDLVRAVGLLREWVQSGAHRRDRDSDGSYEHSSAIALMDEWWGRAAQAIFSPVLGGAYEFLPVGLDNAPGPLGSAYQNGLYGHVHKDLRAVLGRDVAGGFSRDYCGGGRIGRCRSAVRASLSGAIDALTEVFGADPQGWDADEEADMIEFTPVGVQGQDPMQWQNRPTFQQVLEFGG
ncbi:MAG: penicillin acylase family protein [Actinomycetota bacterium]